MKGAKQAGLDPAYIDKLSKQPTYQPNEAVLKARRERPKPEELKEITVEELSKNENWISCLGFILEPPSIKEADRFAFFTNIHRGM